MASIIAAKAKDKQYEIVGKAQNLLKQVQPLYNVGFSTTALDLLNAYFTYMQAQGFATTRAGTGFVSDGAKLARLDNMLDQVSKTGYVVLTGTGAPIGETSGTAFDTSFTALRAAFLAATTPTTA
uniref:Gp47 n=1 Tax=Shigella phage Buco TaxID=2530183 RepID=UPI002888F89C|nr:Chain L, Gp47 [Shigella phage Buco]8ELD_M Chain M, Gp47 [Shigella phage Buco]